MKNLFFLSFMLISIVLTAGGGGGGGSRNLYVRQMESTYNLFYCSIELSLTVSDGRGKTEQRILTTNLAIYDIAAGTTNYLFPDTMLQDICAMFYASKNDEKPGDIGFFVEHSRPRPKSLGLFSAEKRLPDNKLYLITYSYAKETYTFWSADKNGSNLKAEYLFTDRTEFYVDMTNKAFRFVTQKGNRMEIKDFRY